jgi:glucose/arabinose dehydrogenase
MATNLIVGSDGANAIAGTGADDLVYGFDPNGPQGTVTSFAATRVASGLSVPLFAAAPPGDFDRLFLVEKGGLIKILDLGSGQVLAAPFLDVTNQISASGEQGLLGLAFDPDFVANGRFYVNLINTSGDTEIRSYQVSAGDANLANPASASLIIRIDQPDGVTNHKGGWVGFGPDGDLYTSLGDGGGGGDPFNNGQNINTLLGKIIRLNVNGDDFPSDPDRNYAIPPDNPYVGTAGADEIYAIGLRNPFRASFDRGLGAFYIGDVGQGQWEEIDLGQLGANYGWNIFEGPDQFMPGTPTGGSAVPPIYAYDHSVGRAVIGGYVYRGTSEGLQGQYFFADEVDNRTFTLRFDGSQWVATERTGQISANAGAINNPSSFGEDGAGNLYLVDLDGDIFRLTPNIVSADQADSIQGAAGNDILFGGAGADMLDGGPGADVMTGGPGADRLVLGSTALTEAQMGIRDQIADYSFAEGDRIDLSQVLAGAFADGTGQPISSLVRVTRTATGTFLQIDADGLANGANWVTLAQLGGLQVNNAVRVVLAPSRPVGAIAGNARAALGDLNGDGKSDLLWQQDNGSPSAWLMNGATPISQTALMAPPPSWHTKDLGDFNGDGKADLLWQNEDGTPAIWLMNGTVPITQAALPSPPSSWHVIGADDFNADGRDDILWQHDDGTPALWLMNGTAPVSQVALIAPPSSWHARGTGDFNNDGRADILWQNNDGTPAIWLMNGTTPVSQVALVKPPPSWHAVYAADFNGDGKADILWQNDNGTPAIWLMNGTVPTSQVALANPGPSWHTLGAGDVNADGKADILWQHDTGMPAVWLMDGTTPLSGGQVALTDPGLSLHVPRWV